ncbi:hypothetical protein D9756_003824 [Leucocoprinus leucothites]|uniref:Uncharacterized protein n=1 Tax=Leucocoprinus leucothites TaxID=201217 RepID=A0A8H5D9G7_9AGAR|nr:hypothetical protein D9756_003824 [Leucoagaricus leucothites]
MNSSLHFDYSTFGYSQNLGPCTADSDEFLPSSTSAKDDSSGIAFGPPFDSVVAQFSPGGLCNSSYATVETPFFQDPSNGTTCWTESRLDDQRGSSYALQVHAPVPVPGCAPILRNDSCYPEDYAASDTRSAVHHLPAQYSTEFRPFPTQYGHIDTTSHSSTMTLPQSTFPTPSELLVGLSAQSSFSQQRPHLTHEQQHRSSVHIMNKTHRPLPFCHRSNFATPAPNSTLSATSSPLSDTTSESITSHEKKRHYLECLEHYVGFLHDHFRRNGIEPASLERISSYRCLSSRSIRSLLIHMEKTAKQMQEQILREEQKFLRLREAIQQQESALEVARSGSDNI